MAYTNIDDPSAYFQTLLWTGNDVDGRALTNDGNSDLQPDLVWLKNRNVGYNHFLVDSSRGTSVYLSSNTTTADTTWTNLVESFDTDGFTVGDDGSQVPNHTGNTFVGWQWKANGGTTASNSDGSKTATVQANQDAGFSIVTYAGSGSASTVGHGLADTPDVIIFKNRSAANVWATYHQGLGNNLKLELNGTGAQDADGSFMNGTLPTSSVFTVGASVNTNGSGSNYVAYCFAEKQGYSKFGKYVANSSTDNTFVYLGFRPACVIIKCLFAASNWRIFDHKRLGYNVSNSKLYPNLSNAEGTATEIDFLSNGFKIRSSDTDVGNNDAGGYIYMAFAENPFTTSTGIPTTAR